MDDFFSVTNYRIRYFTFFDILSNIGGFLKIINILISVFKHGISEKLALNEILDDIIISDNKENNIKKVDKSIKKINPFVNNYEKIDNLISEGNYSNKESEKDTPIIENEKLREKKKKVKSSFCSKICCLSKCSTKNEIILLMDNFSHVNLTRKMNEIFLLKYSIFNFNKEEIQKFNDFEKKEGLEILETSMIENKFEKENFEERLKSIESNLKKEKN